MRGAIGVAWCAMALVACSGIDDREPGVLGAREFTVPGTGGAAAGSGAIPGGAPGMTSNREGPPATSIPGVEAALPPPASELAGAILQVDTAELDFGAISFGTVSALGVQVRNVGDQPLTIQSRIRGSGAAAFVIAEACPLPLLPSGGCVLSVRFSPSAVGEFQAELELAPESGEPRVVALSAEAFAPSSLAANRGFFDFGRLEANAERAIFRWTVTNGGGVATGTLALTAPEAPFAVDQNGCAQALAPGASCDIDFSFTPGAGAPFASSAELGDGSSRVALSMSGRGAHRLQVTRVGSGQIESSPAGLSCSGSACTGLFDAGSVTLTARTANGSGSFFSGWSTDDCQAKQECSFTLDASLQVTATFQARTNNLIFLTSTLLRNDLGGLAPYDAECNRLANDAGINDASGAAYVAAMSASTSSLRQRLGSARGWVRMDGLPFGDTVADIFDRRAVLYAAAFDERGVPTPSVDNFANAGLGFDPLTGTNSDGSASGDTCNDWTSAVGPDVTIGRAGGGPRSWLSEFAVPCATVGLQRVVCMGRTSTAPIVVPRFTGKQMWVVHDYVPGSMTPDQKCQSDRPAGVASAAAFISYGNRSAAAVLDPVATYVRPDGALVGKGADVARPIVRAAPWLDARGAFDPLTGLMWTGAFSPELVSDPGNSCNDWRSGDSSVRGLIGDYGTGSPRWFCTFGLVSCDAPGGIYCVER